MARRHNEDAGIELECVSELCEENPCTWVEGRFNANGEFEPFDHGEANCPECGDRMEPTEEDVVLADF